MHWFSNEGNHQLEGLSRGHEPYISFPASNSHSQAFAELLQHATQRPLGDLVLGSLNFNSTGTIGRRVSESGDFKDDTILWWCLSRYSLEEKLAKPGAHGRSMAGQWVSFNFFYRGGSGLAYGNLSHPKNETLCFWGCGAADQPLQIV